MSGWRTRLSAVGEPPEPSRTNAEVVPPAPGAPQPAKDWYRDRLMLVELLDWLLDHGKITTAQDAIHVVEKPWHYRTDLDDMLNEPLDVA